MKTHNNLHIYRQVKEEKWLMPQIGQECKIDYGIGRIIFAGEIAGFLNPMGEGISAGMEALIMQPEQSKAVLIPRKR